MKKILLGAAFASMAMGATAAGIEMPTNLVKNGFFEEQIDEIVRGYSDECIVDQVERDVLDADGNPVLDADGNPTKETVKTVGVPSWDMAWNPWCVRVDIRANEADYELVFEGNNNLLHIFRFNDNGWTDGGVTQVVKGLEIGKKYTLGALMAYNQGTLAGDWDSAEHGYVVTPCDAEGNDMVGDAILKNDYFPTSDAWEELADEFTATTSAVKIKFYIVNHTYENNHSEGQWMDVDDVVLMPTDDYNFFKENREEIQNWQNENGAGIAAVAADADAYEVKAVYNLQGVEVAKTTEGLKGLYIVRTGKGAKKIVL